MNADPHTTGVKGMFAPFKTTFKLNPECPSGSGGTVPPPRLVITGIGDSGTRGVRNLLARIGLRMCDIVNSASDNECTMVAHNHVYSLLACTHGHITASGYQRCTTPFRAAVATEVDGVARSWQCVVTRHAADHPHQYRQSALPWGFKNPRHIYLLPVLEQLYAAATMPVVVARDPRDICSGSNMGQYDELRRYGHFRDCYSWWASVWSDVLEGDATRRIVIVRIEDLVLPAPRDSLNVVTCLAHYARLTPMNTTAALQELQHMHTFASSYGGRRKTDSMRSQLIKQTSQGTQSTPLWNTLTSWLSLGHSRMAARSTPAGAALASAPAASAAPTSPAAGAGAATMATPRVHRHGSHARNATNASSTTLPDLQRVMRLLGYSATAYTTQAPAFVPSEHRHFCAPGYSVFGTSTE